MGAFTLIPSWIIQDLLVLIATAATIFFIVRKEAHPVAFLMEMFAFTFLYAAVYENFATLMGWYGYGRSILMLFNVPITVPLIEYLVVYASLRLLAGMEIPAWSKPFLVGFMGMLFDFSLDPLSVKQVHAGVSEAAIGRWSWFPAPGDVNILGIPVYNFSGWVLLCGYAAAAFLIGRSIFKRSGYRPWVAVVYPIIAMLAALAVMVSPLSAFLLWLGPFLPKGGWSEWAMLGFHALTALAALTVLWRGKMRSGLRLKEDWPILMVFIPFHAANIILAIAGGHSGILWIQAAAMAIQVGLVALIWARGKRS